MINKQKGILRLLLWVVFGVLFFLLVPDLSVYAAEQTHRLSLSPARATDQNYTVTKSADTNDGACNSDCSLREAIVAANANAGQDTITLPSGVYNLTRTGANEDAGATGDLDIAADLVIQGAGADTTIIDGAANDRVLHIVRTASTGFAVPTVTLRGLTVRNGKAATGGGVYNQGSLTLEQVALVNNQATEDGGALACIDEMADFTIRDSVISGNQALNNQLFQGAGGGIYMSLCGTLTVTRTTFQANLAQNGGAIYLNESGYAISQSSVINNLTLQNGAGLFIGATAGGEISNSTVSGNQASGSGGGIYISGDASATIKQVTIANNQADLDQNGDGDGGGLYSRGFFRMGQSILAGNKDGGGDLTPDCATNFASESQSQGYNLIQNSAGCQLTGTLTSNITGVAPQLGPLQDNGGPTLTHLPASNSPARDLIPVADCANPVDQRGVARPQGANCDSGAGEAVPLVGCDFIASDEASLRRAVACVNDAGSGVYTLTVTADISYTQPISTISNLLLTQLLIAGNGHTLDAQGHGRVLDLYNVQNATLRDLTLTGGRLDDTALEPNGGGLALNCSNDDVASQTLCHWTLSNTVVRNNQAAAGGGINYRCDYHGGGALVVQDSTIRDNQASSVGGGIVYSSDEESGTCALTLRNTLVEGNNAVEGGGIRIFRPRVTIIDSTIRNNRATEQGGGIMARISDGFITMTVRGSTISGNEAGLNGGGLYIASPEQTFDIDLANSTVSGNRVISGTGGGLFLGARASSLNILLFNTTVAQNVAGQGAGVHIVNRDNTAQFTNTLQINNTLIADNPGGDCASEIEGGGNLPPAQLTSLGNNLDSDGSCLIAAVAQASDIVRGTANLGPLADNGGATQTHTLLPGSDALDAGNDATCAAPPVNGRDQRGTVRPQGAHCDIGAVEMQPADGVTLIVTKFTDSQDGRCDADCSLREAISAANQRPGHATIQLAGGTYLLTIPTPRDSENDTVDEDDNAVGDLDIADDLWIIGSPAATTTIDGNQMDRVFEVLRTATVTLEALTIRNGLVSQAGAGLSNSGRLTLTRVQVVENRATSAFSIGHGGGLFNDGTLTVANSLIADNHAGGGEASYGEGGSIRNQGVLTVTQSILRGNRVSDDNDYGIGGGISTEGRAYIERSLLHDNGTSGGPGGAIANRLGGQLTVVNSTLSGNNAGNGAGIANGDQGETGGTVRLLHTTVTNNRGGGLSNRGVTTATNTLIAGNPPNANNPSGSPNCLNEGTFTSLGATLLDNSGNCPSTGPGDIVVDSTTVFTSLLAALADNGGGLRTHALLPGSQAIDSATDRGCANALVQGVDQRGVARPQGPRCDIGAYEAQVSSADRQIFVSSTSSGQIGNLRFRDEDILRYDPTTNAWALLFDGSDVGITDDVDAFAFQADGSLLLSLSNPMTLTGLGLVDDSDIVQFVATTLGVTTTGSFAWYLDGSDVGLAEDSEDIDAIDFAPDGRLLVSVSNNGLVAPDVSNGHDEDLFVLNNGVLGEQSSGTWELYLDGSVVAISSGRDINGLWADPATGDLYLSTNGSYTVAGLTGDKDDIFVCTPSGLGAASACTFSLFWDGDTTSFGSERLDGIDIGAAPATFNPATSAIAAADVQSEPEEEGAQDDEEAVTPLFLPVIRNAAR